MSLKKQKEIFQNVIHIRKHYILFFFLSLENWCIMITILVKPKVKFEIWSITLDLHWDFTRLTVLREDSYQLLTYPFLQHVYSTIWPIFQCFFSIFFHQIGLLYLQYSVWCTWLRYVMQISSSAQVFRWTLMTTDA